MHLIRTITLIAMLGAAAASSPASADGYHHHRHRHGGHFGLYIGAPVWSSGYYSYERAYPYYPPVRVIAVPAAPTVYVERTPPPVYVERDAYAAAPGGQSSDWWYYCGSSRSYYPYVRECREGWQRVPPQPPSP